MVYVFRLPTTPFPLPPPSPPRPHLPSPLPPRNRADYGRTTSGYQQPPVCGRQQVSGTSDCRRNLHSGRRRSLGRPVRPAVTQPTAGARRSGHARRRKTISRPSAYPRFRSGRRHANARHALVALFVIDT